MVEQWDLISIGNLSRNRYWGESDDKAYRTAICTSTVVRGKGFTLIVDPPYGDEDQMSLELSRRTGLQRSDVSAVFLTHEHGDHIVGAKHFPKAQLLASSPVADILNQSEKAGGRVTGAKASLFGCIEVIHTPGHTLTHHSLRFDWQGHSVLIAGDAVMTLDFWRERRGYFNSADSGAAKATIERLTGVADLVVPGHGNYFPTS